jgi:hypothetical protein
MLTWRQSWSDFSSFTSSNQWRKTARKKENEKHWDFIASTSERQINSSRRRMPVSFYRFLRQVSVNTISSVSLWILMRTKILFARRFGTFTSLSFWMIPENSYTGNVPNKNRFFRGINSFLFYADIFCDKNFLFTFLSVEMFSASNGAKIS